MTILDSRRTYEQSTDVEPGRGTMTEERPTYTPPQREMVREVAVGGSLGEAIAGAAAAVLSILGLAGVLPLVLLPIATIAVGAALLFEGGAITARYAVALGSRRVGTEHGGGMTAEFFGGACGVVLGILSLLGIAPLLLIPASALLFGGALMLGASAHARINNLMISHSSEHEVTRAIAREAQSAAAAVHVLIGLSSVTLGILALVGLAPMILSLVAMLGLGGAALLSGSAIGGSLVSAFRQR